MSQDSPLIFQQRIARLQSLLEATRKVHASIEAEKILNDTLKIAVKELEAPWASFTPSSEAEDLLPCCYGSSMPPRGQADCAPPASEAFALLKKEGGELGRLDVAHPSGRKLEADEVDFLEGLALQASIALENARFHQESLLWERRERDLKTARAIQESLLPQAIPDVAGYALAFRSEPCYEIGGDYLDIVLLADGDLLLVVADVAGKGLSSALIASSFRAALHALAGEKMPLPELASRLNGLHLQSGEEARRKYMTAVFALLRPGRHTLEVVNAGHPPAMLFTPGQGALELKSTGVPLGMLPEATYRSREVEFPIGGRLFLYTDGLSEASRGEDEFGKERLASFASAEFADGPQGLLAGLWREISSFEDKCGPCDDKTALALDRVAERA